MKVMLKNKITDDVFDPFIDVYPCKRTSISERLEQEIPYWDSRNPVFIDAPTGLGKTTFVLKSLIPFAQSHGQTVLLLNNRIALNVQVKRRLMEELKSPYLRTLSEAGICDQEDFGCVRVVSYQRLGHCLKDAFVPDWVHNVRFVVADEAHFFGADAMFNAWTEYPLKKINEVFCNSIRIYMTATAYDVRNHIAQIEKRNDPITFKKYMSCPMVNPNTAFFYSEKRRMLYYQFEADFSFADLHFVNSLDSLVESICNNNGKTLVFVDNIEKGQDFANKLSGVLSSCKGKDASNDEQKKVIYLDASSKDSPDWQMLNKTEKFNAKCLVTTKALDNGININDPKLDSVVICSDDRVDLIQMLGRKRRSNGEKVKLYVLVPSRKSLCSRKKMIDELLYTVNSYLTSKEKGEILQKIYMEGKSAEFNKIFPMNRQGKIFLNEIAYSVLQKKQAMYEAILSGATTFEDIVAGWLGKTYVAPNTDRNELTDFINSSLGTPLDDEQKGILQNLVYQAMLEAGIYEPHPDRVSSWKISALQTRLGQLNLPYLIDRSWTINQDAASFNDSASE